MSEQVTQELRDRETRVGEREEGRVEVVVDHRLQEVSVELEEHETHQSECREDVPLLHRQWVVPTPTPPGV